MLQIGSSTTVPAGRRAISVLAASTVVPSGTRTNGTDRAVSADQEHAEQRERDRGRVATESPEQRVDAERRDSACTARARRSRRVDAAEPRHVVAEEPERQRHFPTRDVDVVTEGEGAR